MDLKERTVVNDAADDRAHVVGVVGVGGHDLLQLRAAPFRVVNGRHVRGVVLIVAGQVAEQLAHALQAVAVVAGQEVADAALLAMHHAATQLFKTDVLLHDRTHHVGAGDEHVAVGGHEDEVSQSRGVDRAAGAWPHDDRQLRHDARRLAVGVEDTRVAAQAVYAFLDARAAAVVDGDERAAVLEGHLHRLDDLVGVHLAQRAAHDRGILRRGEDAPAVDQAEAGDDAIARP